MVKKLLHLLLLFIFLISCNKEKEIIAPEPEIAESIDNAIEFSFMKSDNIVQLQEDIACEVSNNQIIAFVPYLLNPDSLVVTFNIPDGSSVTVNNVIQVSGVTKNDFSQPVIYNIKTQKGTVKQYILKLSTFTGLPIINIETEDNVAINSKDVYVKAHLNINGNSHYTQGLYDGEIEIKGRGNTTWGFPKKPYKIKLNQKAQILDMPADKEWVLLANFSDKTLMRNHIAFELSRRLGLKYTPRSRFVEVFLNRKYIGNYLLAEQVKIAKDRVNIKELGMNDISDDMISGGYLLEVDTRLDADSWFKTSRAAAFCIKSPENIISSQYEYIKNYVQLTEDVLYSDSFTDPKEGYAKYLNVDSFVNWYLLNEITRNNDAVFHTSVYMYKDRNDKLCIGPAWDFDIALGNINYNGNDNPEGFYLKSSLWINRLLQDPIFNAKVKERYNRLEASEIKTLTQYINQTAAYLNKSQAENFKIWPVLNKYVWPNAVVLGSYDKELTYLTDWYEKRISWLNNEFNHQL